MEKRGCRDQMVIATKYTSGYRSYQKQEQQSTSVGNSAKSLRVSLEASLKKLKTDYIDILYVHVSPNQKVWACMSDSTPVVGFHDFRS